MQTILLFLLDFYQRGKVKKYFSNNPKYPLLGKFFGWFTLCFMRSDQHNEACSVISQLFANANKTQSTSQRTQSVSQLTLIREVIGVCCTSHMMHTVQ
jgi:hypothetical protein